MKPTPIELRERIVAARTMDKQSMGQIARRLRIPKGTVQNILERYRDEGTLEPRPQNAGGKSVFSQDALGALERDVRKHPDATLEELRQRSGVVHPPFLVPVSMLGLTLLLCVVTAEA